MDLPPADTTKYRTRVIRSDFDDELTQDMARNPTLCRDCACLTSLIRRRESGGVRSYAQSWFTLAKARQGALHGCPFCRLRLRSFSPAEYAAAMTCDHVDFEFRCFDMDDGAWIRFNMWASNTLVVCQKLRMYVVDGMDAFPVSGGFEVGRSTGSPPSLSLAKSWLQACRCCKSISSSDSFLPSRLIDVGIHPEGATRVCEKTDVPTGASYATLSHCWGYKVPLTLTQSKYKDFLVKLPPELPRTFADAVQVTRQLGLRYIWIDSLCIVQDSTEDWARESGLMDRVYRNSWCNIAATSARHHSDGLFTHCYEPNAITVSFDVPPHLHDGPNQWRDFMVWNPNLWQQKVTDSELMHRAWVVQEMLLAPRILHYAHGELFWECDEVQACTTFPARIPPDIHDTGGKLRGAKLQATQLSRGLSLIDWDSDDKRRELWSKALSYYTKSKLTFPTKDKLVAISAIARQVGTPDDYIAGLWKQRLPFNLLWRLSRSSVSQKEWNAPSWSWASTNGPVVPYEARQLVHTNMPGERESGTPLVSVHGITVTHSTSDRYGRMTAASMTITGPMTRLTVRRLYPPDHPLSDNVELHDDVDSARAVIISDQTLVPDGGTVYCLPVQADTSPRRIEGLVLEPTYKTQGEYVRLGVFWTVLGGLSSQYHRKYSQQMEDWDRFLATKLQDDEVEGFEGQTRSGIWEGNKELCLSRVLLV